MPRWKRCAVRFRTRWRVGVAPQFQSCCVIASGAGIPKGPPQSRTDQRGNEHASRHRGERFPIGYGRLMRLDMSPGLSSTMAAIVPGLVACVVFGTLSEARQRDGELRAAPYPL